MRAAGGGTGPAGRRACISIPKWKYPLFLQRAVGEFLKGVLSSLAVVLFIYS